MRASLSQSSHPDRSLLGTSLYDPADPMRKMFFNVLAIVSEFEGDFRRLWNNEVMAITRAKGKLRGKQPKLSDTPIEITVSDA